MKTNALCVGLLAVFVTVETGYSQANRAWNNAGGDSLWSNPANWTGGNKPVSNDNVRLWNDCPDERQNIILDENAWLGSISCDAVGNRHYTITPLGNETIRLGTSTIIAGTATRTVDLTINAEVRVGRNDSYISCYGGLTTLNGPIVPSPTEPFSILILPQYTNGWLVLGASNTLAEIRSVTDARVVIAHPYALGTGFYRNLGGQSLTLRTNLYLLNTTQPLTVDVPMDLIVDNGAHDVTMFVNGRSFNNIVTMRRGPNSSGHLYVRFIGSSGSLANHGSPWVTMAGSSLVMNNPSGIIYWGRAGFPERSWITGAGSLICEAPSSTYLYSTNDFTGGTFIRGSTLRLMDSNRLPTNGLVTVESGGILNGNAFAHRIGGLGGNGTVQFSTTTTPGSYTLARSLEPGLGAGTLTFSGRGTLTLGADCVSTFELGPLSGTSDIVALAHSAGHLALGGTLRIVDLAMETGDYKLFDLAGGTVSGSFASIQFPGGVSGTIEKIGDDVYLRAKKARGTVICVR